MRDGKRVSVQNQEIWQDFIRAAIPPGITQFFFFDGEKIQEIAADDHSEVRLKSSLEAALGIQTMGGSWKSPRSSLTVCCKPDEACRSTLSCCPPIARLEPWQVVSRSADKTEEFVKFTAEAYKNY